MGGCHCVLIDNVQEEARGNSTSDILQPFCVVLLLRTVCLVDVYSAQQWLHIITAALVSAL